METELAPSLTESQLTVLEYLLSQDKMKPSDLLEFLATTPAAVTTLLDRMEKNGLIVRERDEKDRRMVWIVVTEKGKAECERGVQVRESYLDGCLDRISAHNQHLLVYLLGKVAN
jgi:DNA-binding MarR family transcriptional regulator